MVVENKGKIRITGLKRASLRNVYAFFAFFVAYIGVNAAQAQDVSVIADNIAFSISDLPGLISALAYLMGIFFGVSGIIALKKHVEGPGDGAGQMPLRTPVIRLLAGGAFFALPIILQAMRNSFNNGIDSTFSSSGSPAIDGFASNSSSDSASANFNAILDNIIFSISDLPGLVSAFAYLLGVLLAVAGILKIKEHVENPSGTPLREGVIRIATGGALLAFPTILTAMLLTIEGNGSFFTSGSTAAGAASAFFSDYAAAACTGGTGTLGNIICGINENSGLFPAFLEALSYLFGVVLGIWGILKIRDHVLNPTQTNVFEGVSRFAAGGAFFALPAIVEVFRNTVSNDDLASASGSPRTDFNDAITTGGCADTAGLGLDGILVCAMNDVFGPIHLVLNLFTFVAGMIFIMVGISRLIKGAQDGARGPGGLGTIMSFLMGGALVSYNELMRAASSTFVSEATTKTFATMPYLAGLGEVKSSAEAVIGAIIKFMIIVGLISFVRGLFIIRSVSEGANQQASIMAAVTHIIGGALAVNLGPLLNAVQSTLGISQFGIAFN